MAHIEHEQTLKRINEYCGSVIHPDALEGLSSLGERTINACLDASIAPLFPKLFFDEENTKRFAAWKHFMLGKDEYETTKPEVAIDTYLMAMYLKATLCSRHTPIGLFRRNIFRGARVLDIGGGFGFYSALFKVFGAKPTIVEKPEIEPFINETAKSNMEWDFSGFPITTNQTWNVVFISEVLHSKTQEERDTWLNTLIPSILSKDGVIIITEVSPSNQTLYSKLFDLRIKQMTDGKGSALLPHDLINATGKTFNVAALVSWHSLPYFTVIMRKKN